MQRRDRRLPIKVPNFDPVAAVRRHRSPTWVDLGGASASPPPLNDLPTPDDVFSGAALPNFSGLRLRDPDNFFQWESPPILAHLGLLHDRCQGI